MICRIKYRLLRAGTRWGLSGDVRHTKSDEQENPMTKSVRLAAWLMVPAIGLGSAACGADAAAGGSSGAGIAASHLVIEDPWVKAGDAGMTAAFGELVNTGDRDVTVLSATSSASPVMELHETVRNTTGEMVMREVAGGFVIAAGETYSLRPGADHLMLMDLVTPIRAGDEVEFSLVLDDGSDLTFSAMVKDFAGANENYVP